MANLLGVSRSTVAGWVMDKQIPLSRIMQIHRDHKIPLDEMSDAMPAIPSNLSEVAISAAPSQPSTV